MPALCVVIGFIAGLLSICFNMENGLTLRKSISKSIIIMILIIFAAYGFFSGIRGLAPNLN
jgi:hypothetical protein